jgi:hypothetical protein
MTPCLMSTALVLAVAALFWCAGHPAGAVGPAVGGLVGNVLAEVQRRGCCR